jgi:hypothetical protein
MEHRKMPYVRFLHLRRSRFLPQDGGGTCFCVMTSDGGLGGALGYLRPGTYPEFEGEEGWFRVEWHSKRRYRVMEQVDDRNGSPMHSVGVR